MSKLSNKIKPLTLSDFAKNLSRAESAPALPANLQGPNALARIKEKLEILSGEVGNGFDQALTLRDLIDLGVIQARDRSGSALSGVGDINVGSEVDLGSIPTLTACERDFSPPPAPQDTKVTPGFAVIFVEWRDPSKYYPCFAFAEVFRSEVDNIGMATKVGQSDTFVFADNPGRAGQFFYWVRFVSKNGIEGPFNALLGLKAALGEDPAYLLKVLEGEITETQLFKDLGDRIDLIDGPEGMAGSVQSKVGPLQRQYTVKINADGQVAGFGLAIDPPGQGASTSSFVVRADRFAIGSPAGSGIAQKVPFIVRTTASTVNGVNVPAGVYIDEAFIANGTITNAKIGTAAIDTAKIADLAVNNAKIANLDAAKITTGFLSADRIQAGSVTADKINARGLSILDNAGNVILGAGTGLTYSYVIGGPPGDATRNRFTRSFSEPPNPTNGDIWLHLNDPAARGKNVLKVYEFGFWGSAGTVNTGAFSDLDRLTAGNISTYIESAAIGQALIGNAAIGTAQIQDAVITNAKISNASVDILKIAGDSVFATRNFSFSSGFLNFTPSFSNLYGTFLNFSAAELNAGGVIPAVFVISGTIAPGNGTPAGMLVEVVHNDAVVIASQALSVFDGAIALSFQGVAYLGTSNLILVRARTYPEGGGSPNKPAAILFSTSVIAGRR